MQLGADYYLSHGVYPELWSGIQGAWLPSLGNTGAKIPNQVSGGAAAYVVNGTLNRHCWATNSSPRGGRQIVAQGDGSGSYTFAPFRMSRVRQATVSLWVGARGVVYGNPTATQTGRYIFAWVDPNTWNTTWGLNQNNANGAMWLDGAWRGSTTTWPQTLTHYALVWGPGRLLTVYQDGVSIHSHTMAGSAPSSATETTHVALGIGGGGVGGCAWDDLRTYSRALTPSEIQILAQYPGIAYETTPRRMGFSTTSGQTITPTGIASTLALGSPTVTTGAVDVTASGIASTLALGQPTVSADATNVSVTGIASTLAIGQPTITTGAVSISATGITATLAIGQPTISVGAVSISATGIASTLGIGQPVVTVGDVAISVTGIASALALGQPTITVGLSVSVTGIASTAALGQPTVTTGAVTVSATGIASSLAIGEPTITTGALTISATGISSVLAVGQPTVTTSAATISATGIGSTLAIGQPTVTTGAVTVSATGIASTLALGQPTVAVAGSGSSITVTGIASTIALGSPSVVVLRRADSLWQASRQSTSVIVPRWGEEL